MLPIIAIFRAAKSAFSFAASHWRAALAVILAVALFAAGWHLGAQRVTARWNAEKAATAKAVQKVASRQAAVTTQVQTRYVDRVRVIHEQGKTLTKEVIRYVPVDFPALPGTFRLFYDAAAAGLPLPDPASGAVAAPVPAQDLARTDADNLTGCRANVEQVKAWQAWAAKEAAATH